MDLSLGKGKGKEAKGRRRSISFNSCLPYTRYLPELITTLRAQLLRSLLTPGPRPNSTGQPAHSALRTHDFTSRASLSFLFPGTADPIFIAVAVTLSPPGVPACPQAGAEGNLA